MHSILSGRPHRSLLSWSCTHGLSTAPGLFGVTGLHSPQDWPTLVANVQDRCAAKRPGMCSGPAEDRVFFSSL